MRIYTFSGKNIYFCRKTETMLSKKTRYAMLALCVLAREYGKTPVPIGRIADAERIPQRFLEGILLVLKNRGLLGSTRGKTGGYYLVKRPDDVSLFDVVVGFEESVGMLACVCENGYRPCEFCKDETTCPIRAAFSEIYRSTADILRRTTLSDLASRPEKAGDTLNI